MDDEITNEDLQKYISTASSPRTISKVGKFLKKKFSKF
jgi:hypothetical protein